MDTRGSVPNNQTDVLPLPAVLVTSLLTWSVVAGSAVALAELDPRLALVPAVLAALTVPSALRLPRFTGLAVGGAMLAAAAVPFAPVVGWVVVAVLAAGALRVRPTSRDGSPLEDLQRHLSFCRRREATADVLTLHVPATSGADADAIRDGFRYTDSVNVRRLADGFDVVAVLDTQDLVREGVEQRLRALLGDVHLGWARFPDDGVTLEALDHVARVAARPAGAVPPAPVRATAAAPAEAVS